MKKRFLSLFLALALCLGLVAPAFAAEPEFVVENGVLTKYNGPGRDVTIPSGVTAIGIGAFQNCTSLTSITIPNSVTAIWPVAFWGCTSLSKIIIPNSVTRVGQSAFASCTGLTDVELPDGLTEIEDNLFFCCTSLVRVTIPDGVKRIGDHAFCGCDSMVAVAIPGGVTEIGEFAFSKCTKLSSVNIPKNVTEIAERVFDECLNLHSVVIPNGVTKIGNSAFCRCRSLYSITIPESVVEIDNWAFGFCSNLENIYYSGTKAQWAAIDFGEENEPLLSATIHYSAATTPSVSAAPSFTDVPAGAFYADAVNWAVGKDITNGTGGTSFSPGRDCTHAQILTFLYRAARGQGAASAGDMDKAINWAREKGMIGADFNSSAKCTRADAVNYIWQAFDKKSAPAGSFHDVDAGASYAKAVDWAVANGITDGTGGGNFSPDKVCNRGTIATFLHRAYVPEVRLTSK